METLPRIRPGYRLADSALWEIAEILMSRNDYDDINLEDLYLSYKGFFWKRHPVGYYAIVKYRDLEIFSTQSTPTAYEAIVSALRELEFQLSRKEATL